MFRPIIILTVLTLAAGPDAALLCGTWCDQGGRVASACRHEAVANVPAASASDCCPDEALGVPVVLFKARVHVSPPDGAHATVGLHLEFALPTSHGHRGHDSPRLGSFDNRPLATILRI
jgi:hypothetical protein